MSRPTEHIVDTHGGIESWDDMGILVRCKDCVFAKQIKSVASNGGVATVCTYQPYEPLVWPDDFCSHGRAR